MQKPYYILICEIKYMNAQYVFDILKQHDTLADVSTQTYSSNVSATNYCKKQNN